MTTCAGCKFYEPNGVARGMRKYSKCNRPGAREIAMDERQNGECGPDAALKNADE